LFVTLILFIKYVNAEVSIASDKYYYGPSISDNTACERALEKAKISALEKVVGTSLSSFQGENCSEINDKTECMFFEDTIAFIGEGFIKNFTFKEFRNKKDENLGNEYCEVEVTANILEAKGKADANFNINTRIEPRNIFIDGSKKFSIQGIVTKPSFIQIFIWYPYENSKNYVCASSYFPNYKDLIEKIVFPPEGQKVILRFPDFIKQDTIAEYVLIIATKDKLKIPCLTDKKTQNKIIEREKLLNILNKLEINKWAKQMLVYKIVK